MNVTVENLAPCKKLVRVEVEAQEVDKAFETATKQYQRQVSLPGFRPGKAPREMVIKRYGQDIENEVKKNVISDAYRKAISEQKLDVVGYPDIEEIQFGRGQTAQFAATVETSPEFEVPEYKGIPLKKEVGSVTDADVERAITALQDRKSTFDTVEREVRNGDVVVVNYTGTCDGKPITDTAPTARGLTEQKGFWINVAADSFIPGFTDQLLGTKAGDKRTVNVDFPADFVSAQLAGKKGSYEVEVVEVKEKKLPELNDAFAKEYGAENLDKLKEGVRNDLQNETTFRRNSDLRTQAATHLLGLVSCELPESVVQHETRNVAYSIINENQRRGVPKEVIDEKKDEIYANASTTAKDRVKASFIFGRIAGKEGIKVEQNEVGYRIHQMAQSYQTTPEKLVKELEKRNGFGEIYEQILNEKVLEFLVKHATIEEVPAAAPAAPAAEVQPA